jgi:hypothetical protein
LTVEAADGYKVVFALAEIDPAFAVRDIILADKRDGKPLDAKQGPFRIVAPGDKRGACWVRQVTALRLIAVSDRWRWLNPIRQRIVSVPHTPSSTLKVTLSNAKAVEKAFQGVVGQKHSEVLPFLVGQVKQSLAHRCRQVRGCLLHALDSK